MAGPNEYKFVLRTTVLTGTSHRQGQILKGCLQLHRHQRRIQPWMFSLVSSMAASVGTLPFRPSLAAAKQRPASAQRWLQCFPSSIPSVMWYPKGSSGKDVCGCVPPSSVRQSKGGKREKWKTFQPHAFLFLPGADRELPTAFPLEVYRKGELISFDEDCHHQTVFAISPRQPYSGFGCLSAAKKGTLELHWIGAWHLLHAGGRGWGSALDFDKACQINCLW